MGRDDSGSRLRPQARLAAQPSCELKLLLGPDALAEGLLLSGLLLLTLEGVHGVTFRLGTGEREMEGAAGRVAVVPPSSQALAVAASSGHVCPPQAWSESRAAREAGLRGPAPLGLRGRDAVACLDVGASVSPRSAVQEWRTQDSVDALTLPSAVPLGPGAG